MRFRAVAPGRVPAKGAGSVLFNNGFALLVSRHAVTTRAVPANWASTNPLNGILRCQQGGS